MKLKLLPVLFILFSLSIFSQTLVIGDVTVTEGEDFDANVTVSITNPSNENVIITITQTSWTAGTDDYTETTIVVTIPAGETQTSVDIPITDDNIDEATETFTVNGEVTSGNTTNEIATGIVKIKDDPSDVPTIIIGDVTVTEGEDPVATIPVSITNPSDEDTVIILTQTAATAGTDDYVEEEISVVIPAGETHVTVEITIIDDNLIEGTETFIVNGTSPTANTSNTATVTILDDPTDTGNQFLLGNITLEEGTNTTAQIPITLFGVTTEDLVLEITQNPVTAGINDYTETTIIVTIPAGQSNTTTIFEIEIVDDSVSEPRELFVVEAQVISGGGSFNSFDNSTVVILDNDNTNYIEGEVTYDLNSDNCVTGTPNKRLVVSKNLTENKNYYNYSDSTSGLYGMDIYGEGEVETSIVNLSGFVSTPTNYSTTFTGSNQGFIDWDFCLSHANPGDNVKIVIYPIGQARPGFDSGYRVRFENVGSTTVSGVINIEIEEDKMEFVYSSPDPNSIVSNSVIWNYTDLEPFEVRYIDTYFAINTPTDPTNPVNNGDLLNFDVNITPLTSDIDQSNNTFTLVQEVVNSYDPNDVAILEGPEITTEQATKDLNFRIRFQNTGTASAINVNVITFLDTFLDWDAFTPIDASHDYNISFDKSTGQIEFDFPDINLPDSTTNEPESHGWILFTAKPKDTFAIGDIISATADIFFDFNAPITTNTATTQIEANLGVEEEVYSNIKLYPNPTSSELLISGNNTFSKYSIYDIQGREVLSKNLESEIIKVNNLKEGIYYLRLSDGRSFKTYKFIKK